MLDREASLQRLQQTADVGTLALWARVSEACSNASVELPVPFLLKSASKRQSAHPVFGFVHVTKAGGGSVKTMLADMSKRRGWPLSHGGEPAHNNTNLFAVQPHAARSRNRVIVGSGTLCNLHLADRQALVLTTLRPPIDRAISQYNYACACNAEHKEKWNNCKRSVSEFAKFEASTLINTLLASKCVAGGASLAKRAEECLAALTSEKASADMEQLLLELLQTQLRAPCVSVLPTYELARFLPMLKARWRLFDGFDLGAKPLHINALASNTCSTPGSTNSSSQVNASDPDIRALIEDEAARSSLVRTSHRLWRWFDENKKDLMRRQAAPCIPSGALWPLELCLLRRTNSTACAMR